MAPSAWQHPPLGEASEAESLLTRMGGMPVLTDYVYGLYDNMLADTILGAKLKSFMQTAPHDVYMKHLKDRTVDYLEVVWGGEDWEGQDLFAAHMHLQITPAMFDRCIKCGGAKLKAMKLSSGLCKEILEQMNIMKEPITDPQGKFRRWVDKRNEELEAKLAAQSTGPAVDPTGMGFTTSPENLKMWADKERKQKEMRERLAAKRAENAKRAKEALGSQTHKVIESVKKVDERSPKAKPQSRKAKAKPKRKETTEAKDIRMPLYPLENLPTLPADGPAAFVPHSIAATPLLLKQVETV